MAKNIQSVEPNNGEFCGEEQDELLKIINAMLNF